MARPQSVSVGCNFIAVICPQSRVKFLARGFWGNATIVVVYVQQHTLSTNRIASAPRGPCVTVLCDHVMLTSIVQVDLSARINCPAGTPSLALLPTTCKYQPALLRCLPGALVLIHDSFDETTDTWNILMR